MLTMPFRRSTFLIALLFAVSFAAGFFLQGSALAQQCTGDPLGCTVRDGAQIIYANCGLSNCLPGRCQTIQYRCRWDTAVYTTRFCVSPEDCVISSCVDCEPL